MSSDPPWEDVPTGVVKPSAARAKKRSNVLLATILCHPDPERVGDQVRLGSGAGGKVEISRSAPEFGSVGGPSRPLMAHWVSRRPVELKWGGRGFGATAEAAASVLLGDRPLDGTARVAVPELREGVLLTLGGAVVLLVQLTVEGEGEGDGRMLGRSAALDPVRGAIRRVGPRNVTVLITGESGVGKELVARAVHAAGRADGPFVAVNMAALSPGTAASALFGHERGAFTGAATAHRGLFEQADGGTLFLDEVGAAPPEVQDLLLRVLETGEVRPLGASKLRRVDVRVVSATDTDLEAAVAGGRFHLPLLHRLAGYQIPVPPLRRRREDIGILLLAALTVEAKRAGLPTPAARAGDGLWIEPELMVALATARWPGNVRELQNVARTLVLGTEPDEPFALTEDPVEVSEQAPETRSTTPSALDEDALRTLMRKHDYSVGAAAAALGVSRTAMYTRLASSTLPVATRLSAEAIRNAVEGSGGDLTRAAARLEVSRRGLVRRMTALGMDGE